jgi:isopenicillin N synthase-like dioxygenase
MRGQAIRVPTIPVIDISRLSGAGRHDLAREVDDACREVGFLQVVGHGIDRSLLDEVYRTSADLWALPVDVKRQLRDPNDHRFYGWLTIEDPYGVPLLERWQINRFESPEHAVALGAPADLADGLLGFNSWPAQLPGFNAAAAEAFAQMRELGARVMQAFALALGQPADFFEPYYRADSSGFAVNRYANTTNLDVGETALVEHTDSGTCTLLHQRGDYEGLEVRLRSGDRVRVPVVPDAFVVNIGELMARWTNDRWIATTHRVIVGEPGRSRMSLTTFYTPNVDAVVAPIPTCVPPSGPSYEPMSVYDWQQIYLAALYEDTPA